MSALWRRLVCTLIPVSTLLICFVSFAAAQRADQLAAARVLGPQWKSHSRAAGMVFAGTVLSVAGSGRSLAVPSIQVKFRVDRAIAGVRSGQVLTIREWIGALSTRPPIRVGQRVLMLLYPPSWLGLTSPVGGTAGQIALDARGQIRQWQIGQSQAEQSQIQSGRVARTSSKHTSNAAPSATPQITVAQLERAIRSARRSAREE
jgi:hypothetical protein